ncbi:PVC-type heme-binding CxxCH protein [Planctomicrobium sp. SH668]|uniref:PVC-type heme-binding CxxCH protein n=1 Tax=Planctomicrobium sp. SH668 TaxID=3448126 RepID=UPI003F5B749E
MQRLLVVCFISLLSCQTAWSADQEAGFKPIFDGKTLDGWKGEEGFWKVADGAIVGETTAEKPLNHNTFLVWERGDVDDFELRLKFRLSGSDAANSGIQFRGVQQPNGQVVGYQADIDRSGTYCGMLYDEAARGFLAERGQKSVFNESGEKQSEQVNDKAELLKHIDINGWNEYAILAKGSHIVLKINGHVTAELIDHDKNGLDRIGILALQLHAGPPMKVEFKDILLKRLPLEDDWKKIVFVAGNPSHAYFSHEHRAGCLLLQKSFEAARKEHGLKVISTVYTNGFPKDTTAFDNASTVVAYCDGGAGHFLNPHLKEFDKEIVPSGIGLVCIHYGVETTKGEAGDHFLKWIGGYFEPHWSVNPHWTATFDRFPDHPISRGVRPFEINDEWYYHMRFVPEMKGVTPILTALPPRESLNREDGPHSNNPAVREAVLVREEPQHMGWAYDREDGKGRGFGFTGGHNHVNWQHDDFRKVVLNAILWTAHGEVPENGVESPSLSKEEMEANQDEPAPADFKFHPVQQNKVSANTVPLKAKPIFQSPIITPATPGHGVKIDVDVSGAKSLYLVVTDAGDGYSYDWANWGSPTLLVDPEDPSKGSLKLTELKWETASSAWGEVRVNANAEGRDLRINGKPVPFGIGTHANSVIHFKLPDDHKFTRFQSFAGIDDGGSQQGNSSVRFLLFNQAPPESVISATAGGASHETEVAVEQLDVHPDLVATLFASEPMMSNPSTIDIDHLGRIWMCEAINYRAFANRDVIGERPESDRILVLEDVDGDGVADKSTTFYSGPDVDSAHGVLVLPTVDGKGLRLLVSALDKVFFLIDDNGDLKADRKEVLFTGIDGAQHDHGIHAVHFGPDGKFYFNFGNSGVRIKDKNGEPIVDKAGNVVEDAGKPYRQGMVFRCNLDGSDFETLGWNFRNNWEACVDSYGTIWQSDNDDDGNRGVRINYVMEFGNYGYVDEISGAGWPAHRTNMESDIPSRHWHLNDPGVIPNLLLTGGGAPTGITFYEGKLLPKELHGAILHCDAGPNVCRAYVPTVDGAGYTATTIDLLNGARNQWFRPSDVCVAPDGSVFVADWYDPGVGGHRMQDARRGRIFRLAPENASAYISPKVDVSTPESAVEALQSPNMSVRYLAWTALQNMGAKAESALVKLRNSDDPAIQARAVWLLGKLKLDHTRLVEHLKSALTDSNPNIRITGIRLLRQLFDQVTFEDINGALTFDDASPAVRREMLIALREVSASWVGDDGSQAHYGHAWTRLAQQYDGKDRWYLEALGIAANGRWDVCLASWLKVVGDQWLATSAGRDIVWRSRAEQTAELLAKIIESPQTPDSEILRHIRALDFQPRETREAAALKLAFANLKGEPARVNAIRAEAISRLGNVDVKSTPPRLEIIESLLKSVSGQPEFLRIVSQFELEDHYPAVLALAQSQPQSQLGINACHVLFNKNQQQLILSALTSDDREQAEKTFTVVGASGDGRSFEILSGLLSDGQNPLWIRQAAVRALGSSNSGAQFLLNLAKEGKQPSELAQAFAAALTTASHPDIRNQAIKLYPPPPGKDSEPLPPIQELVRRAGNPEVGKVIYNTTGTCNKCHQVNGIGQDVGPNLSEIGKKLAKPAFYEAILFPSSAISHGYENWLIATEDGQILTGLLVSETGDEIQIKDDKGIVRTIKLSEIEERKKQDISLMPADLQKLMTTDELVDLVEYMTTLQERRL